MRRGGGAGRIWAGGKAGQLRGDIGQGCGQLGGGLGGGGWRGQAVLAQMFADIDQCRQPEDEGAMCPGLRGGVTVDLRGKGQRFAAQGAGRDMQMRIAAGGEGGDDAGEVSFRLRGDPLCQRWGAVGAGGGAEGRKMQGGGQSAAEQSRGKIGTVAGQCRAKGEAHQGREEREEVGLGTWDAGAPCGKEGADAPKRAGAKGIEPVCESPDQGGEGEEGEQGREEEQAELHTDNCKAAAKAEKGGKGEEGGLHAILSRSEGVRMRAGDGGNGAEAWKAAGAACQ